LIFVITAANTFLVYLEHTERVWWCNCSPVVAANSATPNELADLRGYFEARERERVKGKKGGEREMKERGGRKHPLPRNKFLVMDLCLAHAGLDYYLRAH